jgi:hypothetical protein
LKSVATSASLIVLTKAASARAELELLMAAISSESDGLLTTASHQGAFISPREQLRTTASLFFLLH